MKNQNNRPWRRTIAFRFSFAVRLSCSQPKLYDTPAHPGRILGLRAVAVGGGEQGVLREPPIRMSRSTGSIARFDYYRVKIPSREFARVLLIVCTLYHYSYARKFKDRLFSYIDTKIPFHFQTDIYMTTAVSLPHSLYSSKSSTFSVQQCVLLENPQNMLDAWAYGRRKLLSVRHSALCISHPRLSWGGGGARTLIRTGYSTASVRDLPRSAAIKNENTTGSRCGVICFPFFRF